MSALCVTRITCLLYTSDAADEEDSVDIGGRRISKKKKKEDAGALDKYRNKKNTRTNNMKSRKTNI